jgi:hypothetical protein
MRRALVGGMTAGLVAVGLVAAGSPQLAAQKKAAPPKKAKAEAMPLNEKVLAFARSKVGEQLGNGECWTLANDAILSAGGRSSPAYRDFPDRGDHVWGDLVYAVTAKDGKLTDDTTAGKKMAPGDIVQFRDARFEGPRPGGGTYSMTAPHHTAVVAAVGADGKTLGILHQNWSGKKTVAEATTALRDLKGGWVRVYRPLPR